MLAKAMRGVELNGWLVAGAGRDSDVVRNVGVEDVPDKRRCEAATDMRRKDDEGADVNVTWLGTLDFGDRNESARWRDTKEKGVGLGDVRSGTVKRREVANAEEGGLYAIGLEHDGSNGLGDLRRRVGKMGYADVIHSCKPSNEANRRAAAGGDRAHLPLQPSSEAACRKTTVNDTS